MKIESYRFGHIEIDGKTYRNDVKLIGEKVIPEWWRSKGHFVEPGDVRDLINADAEVCIFGSGAYGAMRVSETVVSSFESLGVNVLVQKTEAACNTYNKLTNEGKKVIAAFHLTC